MIALQSKSFVVPLIAIIVTVIVIIVTKIVALFGAPWGTTRDEGKCGKHFLAEIILKTCINKL